MRSITLSNWSLQPNQRLHSFFGFTKVLITLSFFIGGCSGVSPSTQMPTLLEAEAHPSLVMHEKLSTASQEKLKVGLAVVPDVGKSDPPTTLTEVSLARFTDRTKNELENKIPLEIQKVVPLETLEQGKSAEQLKSLGKDQTLQFVLLIFTSSEEVNTPAYLDASSPDVGMLPGNEIENYALVEVALVDLQSGKSLIQAQGRSYALLEQLDVPLDSNRYPLVTGSAMTNRIFPTGEMALEVLRTVALEEALDQALLHFDNAWQETLRAQTHRQS